VRKFVPRSVRNSAPNLYSRIDDKCTVLNVGHDFYLQKLTFAPRFHSTTGDDDEDEGTSSGRGGQGGKEKVGRRGKADTVPPQV
jgi:hypothetical protein